FGVIGINPVSGTAQKCTLCYDRMQVGLTPACAKACPTESIKFGPIKDLRQKARARVAQLHGQGRTRADLYGEDETMLGGLNSFYLLEDRPEVYGLPANPKMPSRNLVPGSLFSGLGAVLVGLVGLLSFRQRRMDEVAAGRGGEPRDV
ncbi:MAG TPA: 4Fe-4S dicluster domain-containing protein, partial [Methylomirabilota bacterium]|nr:4Fe-4S dicluster domain-containing protein [Methylomirabilota bacterium]